MMAHTVYEQLADLESVLDEVRTWPDVREPRPGVFHIQRTPFLHFHIRDGRRWADARSGRDWGPEYDVPIGLSAAERRRFLSRLRKAHAATHAAFVRPSRRGTRAP